MPKRIQNHYEVGNVTINDFPPQGEGPYKDRTIVLDLDADHYSMKQRTVYLSLSTLMNLYMALREFREDIGYNDDYLDETGKRMIG